MVFRISVAASNSIAIPVLSLRSTGIPENTQAPLSKISIRSKSRTDSLYTKCILAGSEAYQNGNNSEENMNPKIKNLDVGEKIQFEILKKFSGEKKVYLGAELYEMVKQLIKDGIRNFHPDLEEKIDSKAMEILAPWFKKRP